MKEIDDIDLPELTEEILNELKPAQNVDLHLGPAEVKKVDKNWYIKEFGPKPLSLEIKLFDLVNFILFLVCCDLIVISWFHVFS